MYELKDYLNAVNHTKEHLLVKSGIDRLIFCVDRGPTKEYFLYIVTEVTQYKPTEARPPRRVFC